MQATMGPVPVVAMQPSWQLVGSAIGVGVGLSVSPFPQRALDEALGLAVGLRRVRPGPDVLESEIAAGIAEVEGFVAGAVVGHDTGDGEAAFRKATALSFFSSGMTWAKASREASSDADMDELPAQPLAAA